MITKEDLLELGFSYMAPDQELMLWNKKEDHREVYLGPFLRLAIDLKNREAFSYTWRARDGFPYPRPSYIVEKYRFPESMEELDALHYGLGGDHLDELRKQHKKNEPKHT